jgi:hypothetical protein
VVWTAERSAASSRASSIAARDMPTILARVGRSRHIVVISTKRIQ